MFIGTEQHMHVIRHDNKRMQFVFDSVASQKCCIEVSSYRKLAQKATATARVKPGIELIRKGPVISCFSLLVPRFGMREQPRVALRTPL